MCSQTALRRYGEHVGWKAPSPKPAHDEIGLRPSDGLDQGGVGDVVFEQIGDWPSAALFESLSESTPPRPRDGRKRDGAELVAVFEEQVAGQGEAEKGDAEAVHDP